MGRPAVFGLVCALLLSSCGGGDGDDGAGGSGAAGVDGGGSAIAGDAGPGSGSGGSGSDSGGSGSGGSGAIGEADGGDADAGRENSECVGCEDEAGVSPWNENSRYLELSCGSQLEGSMSFRANRDQLDDRQLELLAQLQPTSSDFPCIPDTMSCTISISSADGTVERYLAEERESTCGSAPAMIAYQSFLPLLETVECRFARYSDLYPVTPLEPDERCLHGVYSPHGGRTIHQPLTADDAGQEYRVRLLDCAQEGRSDNVTMGLFSPNEEVLLAEGKTVAEPGPEGACLELMAEFPAPGAELDLVITTNAQFLPAGDFYLQFY